MGCIQFTGRDEMKREHRASVMAEEKEVSPNPTFEAWQQCCPRHPSHSLPPWPFSNGTWRGEEQKPVASIMVTWGSSPNKGEWYTYASKGWWQLVKPPQVQGRRRQVGSWGGPVTDQGQVRFLKELVQLIRQSNLAEDTSPLKCLPKIPTAVFFKIHQQTQTVEVLSIVSPGSEDQNEKLGVSHTLTTPSPNFWMVSPSG